MFFSLSSLKISWVWNLEDEEHPEPSAEGGEGEEECNSEPKSHPQGNGRKKGDRMDFWKQVNQDLETKILQISWNPDQTHPWLYHELEGDDGGGAEVGEDVAVGEEDGRVELEDELAEDCGEDGADEETDDVEKGPGVHLQKVEPLLLCWK